MKRKKAQELLQEAIEGQEQLVSWRRYLHAHAETGFDLPETTAYVTKELAKLGISAKPCGTYGLVAELGKKENGTVFLLRADMDGLPVTEESGVSFSSKNGNAHACGHDMHTAMLLGAARLLKEREQELMGTVRLLFQPAEELLSGAKAMMEAGVLEHPPVTGAMMLHVMAEASLPAGAVIVAAPGVSAPSADYFNVEVVGKGCHGSSPNLGIDPVNAAAHVILALQAIQTRELSMGERASLTVGSVQGGEAANVIPDRVSLRGTLRTYTEETREFLKRRLREVAEQTAGAFGAGAEVSFPSGCPALQNDKRLSETALACAKELFGVDRAFSAEEFTAVAGRNTRIAGSEDFSYISAAVPSVMVAVAAGKEAGGMTYPLHHPRVQFDEAALPFGSALLAFVALQENNLLF